MIRKAILGVAAVVIGAAAVVVTGTAASATPAAGSHYGSHFTVVEHAITDTVVDTGPAGDSLGDVLAFGNPIYDARNVIKVGSDNGSCIRTKVGAAWECSWTTLLKGGSIVVEGPYYDAADSTLAITGGTGAWATARGSMVLHARDAAGSAYDFVFTIQH